MRTDGASQVAQWQRIHLPMQEHKRHRFDPWIGKVSWSRKWQPIPIFFSGKFHGQRNLEGLSIWSLRHDWELNTHAQPRFGAWNLTNHYVITDDSESKHAEEVSFWVLISITGKGCPKWCVEKASGAVSGFRGEKDHDIWTMAPFYERKEWLPISHLCLMVFSYDRIISFQRNKILEIKILYVE